MNSFLMSTSSDAALGFAIPRRSQTLPTGVLQGVLRQGFVSF